MDEQNNKNLLKFLELVGRLKHVERTGWVLENVQKPETISGHMYRMAVMCFLLEGDSKLDRTRCMELSLVHDMAECIVGDLTPFCGVSPDEKHKREDGAMKELADLAGSRGDQMYELFKEYEEQSTPEAKFVKELDRLDMVVQAFEYEKKDGRQGQLQQFFDSTKGKFSHPLVTGILSEVNEQRSSSNSNEDVVTT